MTRQLLALLLLGSVIVLALHLDFLRLDFLPNADLVSTNNTAQNASRREPILYIHNLERRHFDANGQPSSQIFTDRAFQYSDDEEHLYLENATFFFGNNTHQQWQGKAKNAKVHFDSEISVLSNNVLFFQLNSSTKIETETLTINNISKIATSNDLVTIYDDISETTAIGMEANLQEQDIWLQSHVHSVRKPLLSQPAN